jgi:hypothetical protein
MIDPRRLQLEITETAILEDTPAVTRQLRELRRSGVKVVLDDFGTGYSSLSQLTNLVIDGVKIDRSFTRGVPGDKVAVATLNSVASLTRDLGLSLTVEGVETEQQANWLHRFGDIDAQGFYFSRPVAPANLRVGKLHSTIMHNPLSIARPVPQPCLRPTSRLRATELFCVFGNIRMPFVCWSGGLAEATIVVVTQISRSRAGNSEMLACSLCETC